MDIDNAHVVTMRYRIEPWMLMRGLLAINRLKLTLYGIGTLVLSILCLCTSCLTHDRLTAYVLSPALIVLYLVSYGLMPWLHCRRIVREPNLAGEFEMTAGEAGLRGKNPQMVSQNDWSVFTRYVELEGVFVLRIGKRSIIVIPKSAFVSVDDMERFRGLLASKITAS